MSSPVKMAIDAEIFEKPIPVDGIDETPMDRTMRIVELDKAGVVQRQWAHGPGNSIVQVRPMPSSHTIRNLTPVQTHIQGSNRFRRSLNSWREYLSDAFLPVGFPHSVTPDYLAYQTYDSLQAFFSTITSMLANRAILEGLGVGDASSSATYALLLTVLKDAMSRVATIAFAQRFGLAIEPECKSYRFLADLLNDSAFFLDLVSPVLEGMPKVVVLSSAEALRALCGVAAGASKAALSSHFARQDNLAELNAKEASQETAIGLIGLVAGTAVVKLVEDRSTVFCLMVTLVFVHLLMNYLGVRAVTLRTLNRQRATILSQQWVRTARMPTPSEVSRLEAIVLWRPILRNRSGEETGTASFAKTYAAAMSGAESTDLLRFRHFWLVVRRGFRADIRILMLEGAEPVDVVEAWLTAADVAMELPVYSRGVDWETWDSNPRRLHDICLTALDPAMRERIEKAGWDLSTASFETAAPVRIRVQGGKKDQ